MFERTGPEGYYLDDTGASRTGISVWDASEQWTMSVFSCGRARMRPTPGLYHYGSRWRSTSGAAHPYAVEEDGEAAVMCETVLRGRQVCYDASAWRLISTTIDLVGRTTEMMSRNLAQADGTILTGTPQTVMLGCAGGGTSATIGSVGSSDSDRALDMPDGSPVKSQGSGVSWRTKITSFY